MLFLPSLLPLFFPLSPKPSICLYWLVMFQSCPVLDHGVVMSSSRVLSVSLPTLPLALVLWVSNREQRKGANHPAGFWALGSDLLCVKEMPKADTWKIQNWQTLLSPVTDMTVTPYKRVKCIKDTSWLWAVLELLGSYSSLRKGGWPSLLAQMPPQVLLTSY